MPSNGGSRRPIAERCWHHHEHARGTLTERQSPQTEAHFPAGGALCRELIHEESVPMNLVFFTVELERNRDRPVVVDLASRLDRSGVDSAG